MSWVPSSPLTNLDNLTALKLSLLIWRYGPQSMYWLYKPSEKIDWNGPKTFILILVPCKHSIYASSYYDYYFYHYIFLFWLPILYMSSRPLLSFRLISKCLWSILISVFNWHVKLASRKLNSRWIPKIRPAFIQSALSTFVSTTFFLSDLANVLE